MPVPTVFAQQHRPLQRIEAFGRIGKSESKMPFQSHAILIGYTGFIERFARERRQQFYVKKVAHPIAHFILCPRVSIYVFEQATAHLPSGFKTIFPLETMSGYSFDDSHLAHTFALTYIHHSIGAVVFVQVANAVKNLILVGMFQNTIVEQSPLFVVEKQTTSPHFGGAAYQAKIIGTCYSLFFFKKITYAAIVHHDL